MSARANGYVSQVYVDENQVVQAESLLFKIHASDYQISVEHSRDPHINSMRH
ncbi:MAG TPA: biotin/lipoyl-binding protein [Bryobacteraceae bacterium]|nr:biotin/lipoyl-binding protein [Bryobacteraceae bacterium]